MGTEDTSWPFETEFSCQAIGLLCEFFENPSGIGSQTPALAWQFQQKGHNRTQRAWQIMASAEIAKLKSGIGELWNSGIVISNATRTIWNGKPLISMQTVYWHIRLCDQNGQWGEWSDIATFKTGILNDEEWIASWIGGFSRLRKSFEIKNKVESAMIFVTGLGMYEFRLNGIKVGNRELTPTHTDFARRIEYAAWDIGDQLNLNENVVSFMLAPGWLKITKNAPKPMAYMQLHIKYVDGQQTILTTDTSWKGSSESPVLEASLYDGEIYDARLENNSWDCAGFDDSSYPTANPCPEMQLKPSAPIAPPIKIVQVMRPVTINQLGPKTAVIDFGQNFSGWCRMKLSDPTGGTMVTLKFAEMLNPDGSVNQLNMRTAKARDIYITRKGDQEWMPRFTYHGFRYVQVENWPGILTTENIDGMVVRSSVERTGNFSCSDEWLNHIYNAMVWTQASNLHDKPTDCPQRDERIGWMGGGQFAMVGCIYNFNVWSFYRKWLQDIADGQDRETGAIIRSQAPGLYVDQAMPMYYAFFGVVWKLWKYYGDTECINRYYEQLKELHSFLESKVDGDLFFYGRDYGDWLSIEHTPPQQIDNVFWFHATCIMEMLAGFLQHKEEQLHYKKRAEAIKTAYNKKWYHQETGFYGQFDFLTQAANAMPYVFGLSPQGEEEKIIKNLLWNVSSSRGCPQLTSGYVGQQHVIEALERTGHWNLILEALNRREYPGWGFMLANGATTLWERWELMCGKEMNSHNQFAQSSSVFFFNQVLSGLSWPFDEQGTRQFIIKPRFPASLAWAEGNLATPWGKSSVRWERVGQRIKLKVSIPGNTCAKIINENIDDDQKTTLYCITTGMEGGNVIEFGSGDWEFEIVRKNTPC